MFLFSVKKKNKDKMGKEFVVKAEEFSKDKMVFGKVDDSDDLNAKGIKAKYSRAAVGYEGMNKRLITTFPSGGSKRRDKKNALHILVKNVFSLGIYPTYVYEAERTEENINGFQFMVPLIQDRDNIGNPTKQDKIVIDVFEGITEALRDWCVEHQDDLPDIFQSMTEQELRDCVQPLHQPARKTATGEFGPTFFAKLDYWAENKERGFPERFGTVVKGPKNTKLNPKDLLKTHGKLTMAFRVHHVNFMHAAKKSKAKIKFDSELAEANFTPIAREESNMCGDNDDEDMLGDVDAEKAGYGNVDHTQEYGDGASNSYGGSDETEEDEETSEERRKRKKKEKKARRKAQE